MCEFATRPEITGGGGLRALHGSAAARGGEGEGGRSVGGERCWEGECRCGCGEADVAVW